MSSLSTTLGGVRPTPRASAAPAQPRRPAATLSGAARRCCAAALALLVATSNCTPALSRAATAPRVEFEGAARVVDGDTLVVTPADGGVTHRVRLFGVDAPESKQSCTDVNGTAYACGVRSADALRKRVAAAGGRVHCVTVNTDRYGRDVAVCDAGTSGDVNTWLVSEGWALAYRQYGGKQYDAAEAHARAAGAGVWAGTLTPPWEWRAQQRTQAGTAATRVGAELRRND